MKSCANDLFGAWAIDGTALNGMVQAVRSCSLAATQAATQAMPVPPAYSVGADGVAVLSLTGPLTKGVSSYASLLGGTSMTAMQANLRQALRDPNVKSMVLVIDSPGGTVAGTGDLADAMAAANALKPIVAVCSDLAASAAYWIASQCGTIMVNPSGMVGSIGTYAVLEDSSGKADREGVKVHVVRAGAFKGAGVPGAPVTSADLAAMQERVDSLNEVFLGAVASGRRMPVDKVRELADGRVWVGKEAVARGLADSIGTLPEALARAGALTSSVLPVAKTTIMAPIVSPRAAVPLALRIIHKPAPPSAPAQLPEVAAYDQALDTLVARGFSRGYARAYLDRTQPQLKAALIDRLRQAIGTPRAAELARALRPDCDVA